MEVNNSNTTENNGEKKSLLFLLQNDPVFKMKFILEFHSVIKKHHERMDAEHRKDMYDIFTPWYVKLIDRIKGCKPYMNMRYRPKF